MLSESRTEEQVLHFILDSSPLQAKLEGLLEDILQVGVRNRGKEGAVDRTWCSDSSSCPFYSISFGHLKRQNKYQKTSGHDKKEMLSLSVFFYFIVFSRDVQT